MKTAKILSMVAMIWALALVLIGCGGLPLALDDLMKSWDLKDATMLSYNGQTTLPAGGAAPYLYDLDANGTMDVVVGDSAGQVYFFLNQSSDQPDFSNYFSYHPLMDADGVYPSLGTNVVPAVADIDNDGQWELIVGNAAGEVYVVDFTGDWAKMQYRVFRMAADGADLIVPGGYAAPEVMDYEGDGTLDLMIGSGDGYIYHYNTNLPADMSITFEGKSTQNFGSRATISKISLTGDGSKNFVVGNADGEITFCIGPFGPCASAGYIIGNNAKVAAGDINHDGFDDLVIGTGGGNIWYVPAVMPTL